MAIDELSALLPLERLDTRLFSGFNQDIGSPGVFGSQVLVGQAAAGRRYT